MTSLSSTITKSGRLNYIVIAYLVGIVYFTIFRLVETLVYCHTSATPVDLEGLYGHALLIGWRFDTVVSCFILALPLLMMVVGELARIKAKGYYLVAHYFTMVCTTLALFACAADIPYFCYFFSRLDAVVLTYDDDPAVIVDMIVKEPTYMMYFGVFVAVAVSYWILMKWVLRKVLLSRVNTFAPLAWSIPLAMLMAFGTFVGMRGRLNTKSPIRVGTASFCNNAFLNQIGLNPAYTFMKSWEEMGKSGNKPVELIDLDTATQVYAALLSTPQDSALAAQAPLLPEGTNVVLVLMESMTVDKTGLFNPATSLTPNLDSLMANGLIFSQVWSAGIHTYNGIYSSLYAHPAILARHTMKHATTPQMCGLPQALRQAGYSTAYFMTHDENFDNMRGFLFNNGFDQVVGQSRYPASEVVGTWGVPDHVMLNHVLEYIDRESANGPFFVCAMTCSDHAPYILPEGIDFKPRSNELSKRIVEYADWSIGAFMQQAATRPWFSNTIFVFVADHGASGSPTYDMSLSYNHVPLLFYAPGRIAPQRVDRIGLQLDLTPTLIGMLPVPFGNNTFGIDLMRQRRQYAYFSADDRVGVVSDSLLYIYRTKQERASLYRYREQSTTELIDSLPAQAEAMRRYAFSMIQMSQQMLLTNTTGCR